MARSQQRVSDKAAAEYALDRVRDLSPPALIVRELREMRISQKRAEVAVATAQALLRRALDEDDIHAIREAALASAGDRRRCVRLRVAALLAQIEESDNLRERLALDRTLLQYLNLDHRVQRDLLVALVPKEVRQATAEPSDEEIRSVVFRALEIPHG